MRFYIYLDRGQAILFAVAIGEGKISFSVLVCVLSFPRDFLNISLFYRSHVTDYGEVVGKGKLYVLLCLDFSLSESALGCDEHKYFSVLVWFGLYLVHAKRLEGTGVGYFFFPIWKASVGQSWIILFPRAGQFLVKPVDQALVKQFLFRIGFVKNRMLWVM